MTDADDKQPQSDPEADSLKNESSEYIFEEESDGDHADKDGEDGHPKDTIKRLRENLKECTQQKQEYLDGWQRAKADMVNTKKEFTKERERLRSRVTEGVIADILPVLDSFDMAFADKEAWNKVDNGWRSGVEHIYNQLLSALRARGVEVIIPEAGEDFDPQLHTSVDTESTESEEEVDTVAACEKVGYRIGDRVIRSANVVVFKEK